MSLNIELTHRTPACACCGRGAEYQTKFRCNITHNLGPMAHEAGLYEVVWQPAEHGYAHARQIIPVLEQGIALMKAHPIRFEVHNSPNGWGLYKNFLPWLEQYLAACREHPDAEIHADA